MTDVTIRELNGIDELHSIFPLVHQSNPELDEPLFRERLAAMLAGGGYRCIAAFRDNAMVGVAGFWTGVQLWCGRFIEPDNVVVDRAVRGGGVGGLMMAWIEAEAVRLGCEMLKLETYAERTRTRNFYKSIGYGEPGIVMVKTLPTPGAMTLADIMAKGSAAV